MSVANGPVPPPETFTPDGVAFGEKLPSPLRTSAVSTSAHAPPLFTRTGRRLLVRTSLPSGRATVVDVSDVSSSTVTGFPVDFAFNRAAWSGPAAGPEKAGASTLLRPGGTADGRSSASATAGAAPSTSPRTQAGTRRLIERPRIREPDGRISPMTCQFTFTARPNPADDEIS
ncbi:hypothetical protein ACW14Y_08635 [Kitasatospora sp. cg17-2]